MPRLLNENKFIKKTKAEASSIQGVEALHRMKLIITANREMIRALRKSCGRKSSGYSRHCKRARRATCSWSGKQWTRWRITARK